MTKGKSANSLYASIAKAALAGAALLLVLPSVASAALMTLTFDDGAYDETIQYPGGNLHGPYDWVESNGIRAAGFWAFDVGTPGAIFQQGHTHIRPDFRGNRFERQHSWTNDLQGLYISLEEGQAFDIVSIDYSIFSRSTTDPLMQQLPFANGPDAAQLLLTTSFDPTAADIDSQWTNIAVDDFGLPFTPWFTENISGFTGITGFYITHNIHHMELDNIVLNVYDVDPIPEPSTALLIGLGLTALASKRGREA
ncbi:MAG: PEP-CTERM sorting domain-containing protein [Myxococcota bacterium]